MEVVEWLDQCYEEQTNAFRQFAIKHNEQWVSFKNALKNNNQLEEDLMKQFTSQHKEQWDTFKEDLMYYGEELFEVVDNHKDLFD